MILNLLEAVKLLKCPLYRIVNSMLIKVKYSILVKLFILLKFDREIIALDGFGWFKF